MGGLMMEAWLNRVKLAPLAGTQFGPLSLVKPDGLITPQGWGVIAAIISAIVCILCYKLSRYITPLIIPAYKKLTLEDQRNWDSRYSSNIHAALCVLFAYDLLWESDFFWKKGDTPMILRTCSTSFIALGMSFGYFAVDFISTFKYNMGGAEMVLHHLGSLLSVSTSLLTGQGHMHTVWMLVTEFTTPLINNRWWLDKLNMKTSLMYVWNGIAILIFWVFARLAMFPPFFWTVYKTWDQIKYLHSLSLFLMVGVPCILVVLNVYWFTKIVKGAWKVLFGRPKAD